jgi:hypothetical protein
MLQTSDQLDLQAKAGKDKVTVKVNRRPVKLESTTATGLDIKRAAIAQGVQIEEDFLLTLEASKDHPARTIADDETITVDKHSEFTANDSDDDS